MKFPAPAVDYRGFRLSKIKEPRFRHVLYWLYWPLMGIRYLLIENFHPADYFHPISCALDEVIPFQEVFVIPYLFWFVFIIGMHLYTFLYDVESFKRYSRSLILSISISTSIFLLYPSCQNLRPSEYPRDNLLTDLVRILHTMDTNTNVCPSEHVIGSLAALAAAINTPSLRTPKRITVIAVTAFFTSIATVFLKQHSLVDVAAAVPICVIVYMVCYKPDFIGLKRRSGKDKLIPVSD